MNQYMFHLDLRCNLVSAGKTREEAFEKLQLDFRRRMPTLLPSDVTYSHIVKDSDFANHCRHEDTNCENSRLNYVYYGEAVCIEYDVVCNTCGKTMGVERHEYKKGPEINYFKNV